MSRQIQIRRGTADEHTNFVGAVGELTMETTHGTLRLHDGTTPGGITLARADEVMPSNPMPDTADYVIETWRADDGTAWYRKYKSGWVEQGGRSKAQEITMPITMRDTNYDVSLCGECQTTNNNINLFGFRNKTPNKFTVQGNVLNNVGQSNGANSALKYWRVCGFAA